MRRLASLTVFAAAFVGLACADDSPRPPKVRQLDKDALTELDKAFDDNPAAAKKKYADVRWAFRGEVAWFDDTEERHVGVHLGEFEFVVVDMRVADLDKLKKGKNFDFEGKVCKARSPGGIRALLLDGSVATKK